MNALVPVAIGVAALGGLALLAGEASASEGNPRAFWLIQGKRYYIVHRLTGSQWNDILSLPNGWQGFYPGFCNMSTPTVGGPGAPLIDVQFSADWCAANYQWIVPEGIAITEA